MSDDAHAAASPPLTAFPWRGSYGGAVRRIIVEYDDHSSTNIGTDSCVSLENTQTDLLSAFDTLLGASIGDYGLTEDDGDDESVAMSSKGGVFVKFGMLRRALAALNAAKGVAQGQSRPDKAPSDGDSNG